MKTLTISISDGEFDKFGFTNNTLAFSDLLNAVSKELARQNLDKCVELAEKYGLASMTMDDITDEVRAVRLHAKGRR